MGTPRAIVIGTGAGGLAAAGFLAKDGFDVLGLEQAPQLGGYLAPFERSAFHFDVGLHYVGQGRPGQMLHRTLTELGIDADGLLSELDPDGFDVYRFPGFEIRNCRGLDRFCDRLIASFPRDARGLRRLFRLASRAGQVLRFFARAGAGARALRLEDVSAVPKIPSVLRLARRTYGDVLRRYLADPHARAVLAATSGDYGLPPSRAAAFVALRLLEVFGDGAFYPRGGSAALRDALVGAAARHGARFRTGALVERILCRDGRAVGVLLAGGERVESDLVVSDADPVRTFGRLLEPSSALRAVQQRVRLVEPSLASFAVYLGMRRDLRAHGLGRADVWDYADWDLDRTYAHLLRGELPPRPSFFLSPSSLKDPTGALAPPGCSTLEVVTFVPYAVFERWKGLPAGARGAPYEAEKQRIAEWLLDAVDERWPGLVGDIVVHEVSTPLTNESYTMAVRGGIYGPAQTPEQSGRWRFGTETPVANLFLAGAGVFGGGVAPCLASGRAAARAAVRAVPRRRRRLAAAAA